jgi:hypothetical protein
MSQPAHATLDRDTRSFFIRTLEILDDAEIPYLLGGAYVLNHYTGISRHTKDLDLFVRPQHCEAVLEAMRKAGFETEKTFEHWLAKAMCDDDFVDVIFSSRNRIATVDDLWFENAERGFAFDRPILMSPPEETIWSKAFIMERERFDGADIAHILRATADRLDWNRLLMRFEKHWHVLLAHLTLFHYIYPSERHRIPPEIMDRLIVRLARESDAAPAPERLCRGTILSGTQYSVDVDEWGYVDAVKAAAKAREE